MVVLAPPGCFALTACEISFKFKKLGEIPLTAVISDCYIRLVTLVNLMRAFFPGCMKAHAVVNIDIRLVLPYCAPHSNGLQGNVQP